MSARILADELLLTWSFFRKSTTDQWSKSSARSLAGQFEQSNSISPMAQNNRIKRIVFKRPGSRDGFSLIED